MTTPNQPRIVNLESLRVTHPYGSEYIHARVAEMSLKHAGIEDEESALIALRSTPKTLAENWVKDFFAAEAPSETNQLIPTAWVNRAIDRELTSATNLLNDNEAAPTETKMNIDNEANSASEANENEEFPVREATTAEREEILGKHISKTHPPQKIFFCSPFGIPIPVISSTPEHARAMAKKAIERMAQQQRAVINEQQKVVLKASPFRMNPGPGHLTAGDLL